MDKEIPLWVLLLSLLLGAVFTVFFGWSVKSTLDGSDRSGLFGQAALAISSFPSVTKSVLTDVRVDVFDQDELISVPRESADFSGFVPLESPPGVELNGLIVRADPAAARLRGGWYLLAGAFSINGEVQNAAIAVSPELHVEHLWIFSEEAVEGEESSSTHRKLIHGMDILSDGSVIFTFDGGRSLQRFDVCGKRLWSSAGRFTHTVSLEEGEAFAWTVHGEREIARVATDTGEIVRRISMDDIIRANPSIDILSAREADHNDFGGNAREMPAKWLSDPFHLNDVEPMPAALKPKFAAFERGDLLISARSLNLVFVVDPDTLQVKWWSSGETRRQHDPDWAPNGRITIYDNRMNRDFSRIVAITPSSGKTALLFDGRTNDFYSRIRGKHQVTEKGNLILTSPQQGRAFEVDSAGNVVVEFINRKPGSDDANYVLTEVIWLPQRSFNFLENITCAN